MVGVGRAGAARRSSRSGGGKDAVELSLHGRASRLRPGSMAAADRRESIGATTSAACTEARVSLPGDPPPRRIRGYTDGVDASSVRRFVDRPWGLLRAAKRRYWAEEVAARGPDASLRASRALWLHMACVRPDWPSDAERAEDLAHHLELKGCLDRAARALARLPDR
jgi:hypothetical protein